MSDNTLLRRHAERWAQEKNRPFDGDLLETVVDMRQTYDDRAATSWPAGSVAFLLLERWPAHGPLDLPDLQVLGDTLDTYWRFLRSTGRMASGSAAPADLAKEARRALPKMADACRDRSKFSTGRVMQEFGRSIGVSLDEAVDIDELNQRLERITTAWNDLPTEERERLLPDPSPKTARGQAMTDILNAVLRETADADDLDEDDLDDDDLFADELFADGLFDEDELFDEDDDFLNVDDIRSYVESGAQVEPERLAAAGQQARDSAFVRDCLALADWVGEGREVTKTGVLRPGVAREAYGALGLAQWEEQFARSAAVAAPGPTEELLVDSRTNAWQSARDCMPLDRLWCACDAAGLVRIGPKRAERNPTRLETEIDWLALGVTLVYGMTTRAGFYGCEPLVALVFSLGRTPNSSCDLVEFRRWWHARSLLEPPEEALPPAAQDMLRWMQDLRLNEVLASYADTGLWVRDGSQVTLTEFGRAFTAFFANALDEGYVEVDDEEYADQVLDYLSAEPFQPG